MRKRFEARFDPARVKTVPIDGSPSKGLADAPVTVVEFADFECPYCGKMARSLATTFAEVKDHAAFVFKFFPLPGHPHGEIAARAAIAAMKQDKFWPMHDQLFAHQDRLDRSDLEGYARAIGLDMTRFQADFDSAETQERIARDRKLGDALGVRGTPTLFINGREFDLHDDMREWIQVELDIRGSRMPKASR